MDTKALRQKILDLAIHGHLLPQDPNDEPAIELLKRINPKAEVSYDEKLPKGWVSAPMQILCSLIDGEKQSNIERPNLDVKFLRGNYNNAKILKAGKYVAANSLLILVDGENSGEVFRTPIEGYQGSTFKQLSINKNIYQDYLLLVINLHRKALRENKVGSAIPHLNKKLFKAIDVPLPPLAEQERIVKEIERWFDLIDIIEKNKTDLKQTIKQTKNKILDLAIHGHLLPQDPNDEPAIELLKRIRKEKEHLIKEGTIKKTKQSPTSDTPQYPYTLPKGWEWTTIGEIFNITSAKRVLKSDWQSEGIPFYRAREIVQLDKEGIADKDLFITPKLYNELKVKYGIPKAGDIMLSAVGSIGNSYIVKENDIFYYKDASVLCLQNVHNLHSKFFKIWLSTPFIHRQMKANSKGTTVDTITLEKLGNYIFPLPPLAEQERIVEKIEKIFAVLDRIEREV